MSSSTEKSEIFNCSFCGKSQQEVKKLIAGPQVYICNECIELCEEIIVEGELSDAEKNRQPTVHEKLRSWRKQILAITRERGVRVSHRPLGITFNEQSPTFLMNRFTDFSGHGSGINVGDTVVVGDRPSPWHLPTILEDECYTGHQGRLFTVAAFVTLTGKEKRGSRRNTFECPFAVLLEHETKGAHPTRVWCGTRSDGKDEKLELVWTGVLSKFSVR